MSRKKRTHLRGKRGQAFADKIRGVPLDCILCVSIDIHKYFHVVMIHNALGEIVTPTFEIDIFQAGFEQLCRAVDEAIAQTNTQVVLTGMEPTSHYFENLARHLRDRPQPVTLINRRERRSVITCDSARRTLLADRLDRSLAVRSRQGSLKPGQ